jgi:hypothetical protein
MADSDDNGRVKLIAAAGGLAVVLLFAAWQFGYFEGDGILSDDPQVAELQRAMQTQGKAGAGELKKQYAQLTPEQQQDFDVRKMRLGMPAQEERLRKFFAQPEAEQWRQIDEQLDAKEAWRQQAAANGNEAGAAAKKKASASGKMDPQQIMSLKQEWTANASPELRAMIERQIQMFEQRRKERGHGKP